MTRSYKIKDFRRQAAAVESLKTVSSRYVVSEFSVEGKIGDYLMMVCRKYGPAEMPDMYFEIFNVGRRGGVKRIHQRFC